jgi:predicted aspartyl protease
MNPTISRALTRMVLGTACALTPFAQAAAEPSKCTYTPVGKLPLRYTGPSLEITTGGSINGTPAEFLVDTGASQTYLTRSGTERRGLKLYDTGSRSSGFGGISTIYATRIDELIVGPVKTGRTTMSVLNNFGQTPSFDAILGAPFLLQADLEISLATKELTFFVPENCGGTWLGYWGKDVLEVGMRRHDENHRNPYFFVTINGTKLEAMIDTGAGFSSISSSAAKRAGIEYGKPGGESDDKIVGIGNYTAGLWYATAKTFRMGEETIQNAELAVQDSGLDGTDMILGADFLRAHRVLFAMSQNKLYFSYVGGEPFGLRRKLEPWIEAEANGGNPDAQLALANIYGRGELVPRDGALAASWLEKAALGGSPRALLRSGENLAARRDYAAAVPRLRAALDKLPADRYGAFVLYIARVKTGQAELAKTELAAAFGRSEKNEWPRPIADFYLGTLPADKLLAQAAEGKEGKTHRCEALSSMGDWYRAHGQAEPAKAMDAQVKSGCEVSYSKLGD